MDFESKKTELFTKAGKIAHEFGAEAAVMIISGDDNNIYTLTSSNFMKKFVKPSETENRPAFHHFRPVGHDVLEPVEIDFSVDMARWLSETQMGMLLDVGISVMDFDELIRVEQQLRDSLRIIERRKVQIMVNHLQYKMQENEELKRQVEEIQRLLPLTSSAVPSPTANGGPETGSNVGPQCKIALVPSTSTSAAAPIANGGPGTATNVGPQVGKSLPSTSTSGAPISTDNSQHNRDPS